MRRFLSRLGCVSLLLAIKGLSAVKAATISVDWFIGSIPDYNANVGDTIEFTWTGFHNVYRHPSGDCSTGSSTEIGGSSSGGTASYIFQSSDAGTSVTFACQISGHCGAGQITTVTVAPSPSPSPGTGGLSCFSEETKVEVLDKGLVSIKDIDVMKDRVKVTSGGYEPVYAFAHYDTETYTEFLQLMTERPGDDGVVLVAAMELTADHMVYLEYSKYPRKASSIKVGDVLKVNDSLQTVARVVEINVVARKGLYAPLLADGKLLVNGNFVASNYPTVQRNTHREDVRVAGMDLPIAQSTLIHMVLSPLRSWCLFGGGKTTCDQIHPDTGLHPFVHHSTKFVHWAEQQNFLFQWVLFTTLLIIVACLYVLEYALLCAY